MTRYRVEVRPDAAKALRAIPRTDADRIVARLRTLESEPRPHGAEKLAGGNDGRLRIRVGDYRVIYRVDDRVLLVLIVAIGHRREVYR